MIKSCKYCSLRKIDGHWDFRCSHEGNYLQKCANGFNRSCDLFEEEPKGAIVRITYSGSRAEILKLLEELGGSIEEDK